MNTKITNEMLAKYFSGNCSDREKQEVEHWKEISEDNSREYEEMKTLWRNAFITNTYNPDPEASLHKIKSKLGFFNKEKAPDSKVFGFHVLRFTLRAAAALLIICAGYWFFHQYTETTKYQELYSVSEIDKKKITILPDSSFSEDNPALHSLWPRNEIKYLDDYTKLYSGDDNYRQQYNREIIGIKKEDTAPGPKNNLLTQNTSSIAVDSIIRNESHEIVKVEQPLPLPEEDSNLTVAENNIKPIMGTSVEEMLQGRSGNVDISATSGDPGAGLNIRIRGTSSLNGDNNPLIVVNGIPYNEISDQDFGSADIEKFGSFLDISHEDIESIEFRNDSATTSKYGAAAKWGVFNIKTKDGNMKSGLEDIAVTDSYIGDDEFIPVRDSATAIASTELKGMESVMGTSVEDMLQGRLGNVDIAAVSGDPVAGLNIRIRGTASLNSNNNPLIVVNGIPYNVTIDNDFDFDSADIEKFGQLIDVSPDDIETIEILKDSASTAIWGSRAANMVIDIKTKRYMKSVKEDVVVTASKIGNDGFLPVRDSATAIARMELKGMESVMGTSVEDMLQGRLGNVDITSVPGVLSNVRMGASSGSVKNNPLIVVNGMPYLVDIDSFDFQNIHNYINVSREDIETFEILKDSATISKYGAVASNGVINVKTKDSVMKSVSVKNNPLIVVNGIQYLADFAKFDFQNIHNYINVSREDIETIETLKDTATISKYGAAATYGVINIKIKDGVMKSGRPETVEEMLQRRLGIVDISSESGDSGAGLNIRSLGVQNSLLIVVNGIPFKTIYAKADLENIHDLINVSPEDIESIEFLKDTATISKYGATSTYGVIYIKTKDGKTEK